MGRSWIADVELSQSVTLIRRYVSDGILDINRSGADEVGPDASTKIGHPYGLQFWCTTDILNIIIECGKAVAIRISHRISRIEWVIAARPFQFPYIVQKVPVSIQRVIFQLISTPGLVQQTFRLLWVV